MHSHAVLAFLFCAALTAVGQTPVEYAHAISLTTTSGRAFSAHVVGTAHPEILIAKNAPTIEIVDRHAPSGTTTTTLACAPNPIHVRVADVDQDGDQDILVLSKTTSTTLSDTLSVFFQSGSLFTRVDTTITGNANNFDVGDFDGDSDPDIVFGPSIYLNDAFGGDLSSITVPFTVTIVESLFGDFDGDGDLDVLGFAQGSSAGATSTIQIMRQNSGGSWTPRSPIHPPGGFLRVRIGDTNGDGRDDACLMIVNQFSKIRVRSYLGQVSAAISAQTPFEVCGTFNIASDIEIGDLDLDGDLDAFMSASIPIECTPQTSGQDVFVALLSNDGTGIFSPMPGVGVADITTPSRYGEVTIVDEDLDGDLDFIGSQRDPIFSVNLTVSTARSIPTAPVMETISVSMPTVYASAQQDVELGFNIAVPNGPARGHFASLSFSGNAAPTNYFSDNGVANISGDVGFTVSVGTVSGFITASATTVDGASATATIVVNPSISLVSGAGQTSCTQVPFAQPLVVLLTAGGNPVPNADITFSSTAPPGYTGVSFSATTVKTNSSGIASVTMSGAPAGMTSVITATAGAMSVQTTAVTLSTTLISAASGNGQAAIAGTSFAQPIVVQTFGCQGPPPVGAPVTFQVFSTLTSAVLSSTTVLTDASGQAGVNVTAGPIAGPLTVRAQYLGQNVNFDLLITNTYLVTSEGGDHQATGAGSPFARPIEVLVVDATAQPVPGLAVTFSVIQGSTATTFVTPMVLTDSQGRASTIVVAGAGINGTVRVRATVPSGDYSDFDLVIRRLSVSTFGNVLLFTYNHDHPQVPLIFAVDTPLPPPGYVTTPFGNIATSILAPGPGFVALDGFGVFGSIDPGMSTNSSNQWFRGFTLPPFTIGASFVAQIYGYDIAYPGLDAYFVSNPVVFTL